MISRGTTSIVFGGLLAASLGCLNEEQFSRKVGQRDALRHSLQRIAALIQMEPTIKSTFHSPAEVLALIKGGAQELQNEPRLAESLARGEDALGGPLTILTAPDAILVITAQHRIFIEDEQFAVRVDRAKLNCTYLDKPAEIAAPRKQFSK